MSAPGREHRLRALLDAPLRRRPAWSLVLTPLLLLASVCVACVAAIKRGRAPARLARDPALPLIVCVGNVIVGGTGKSPLVRLLAASFLRRGWTVGIVARGVGVPARAHGIAVTPQLGDRTLLSDENREHLELLAAEFGQQTPVTVLQGAERTPLIDAFALRTVGLESVCILDDGLQHVRAPRHLDLCVWDPGIVLGAPAAALPLGPYREGFPGRLAGLLRRFDARIWSRAPDTPEGLARLRETVERGLSRFGLGPDPQRDVCVGATLRFCAVSDDEESAPQPEAHGGAHRAAHALRPFPQSEFLLALNAAARVCIVTGIARPERFLADLDERLGAVFSRHPDKVVIGLGDHAPLTTEALASLTDANLVVLTAKDYFRWADDAFLRTVLARTRTVVCVLEASVKAYDGRTLDFSEYVEEKWSHVSTPKRP